MAHKQRKTKTEHPSGRPQREKPSNSLLLAKKGAMPRPPRLPGHGMR